MQDVNRLRQILTIGAFAAAIAAFYFLYQRQLGAVAFFLLSIYFLYQAMGQLSGKKERKPGRRKKT
jgi:lipopolysaccharide export LptBFGC system permease protein LptF